MIRFNMKPFSWILMVVISSTITGVGIKMLSEPIDKTELQQDMREVVGDDGETYLTSIGPRIIDSLYLYMTQSEFEAQLGKYPSSKLELLDLSFNITPIFYDGVLVGLSLESDSTMQAKELAEFSDGITVLIKMAYGKEMPNSAKNSVNPTSFDWRESGIIEANIQYYSWFRYEGMWIGFGHTKYSSTQKKGEFTSYITFTDEKKVHKKLNKIRIAHT